MTFNKKAIILLVSIALVNVALSAIINFHFYRIFGKELAKVESKFIKKDDNYISVKSFDTKHFNKIDVLSVGDIEKYCLHPNLKFGSFTIIYPIINNPIVGSNLNYIFPTRGSPCLS